MTDINHVILVGRLTRDLDDKNYGVVGNGQTRANVSIAVNRAKKVNDRWENEANFFDVTIWGNQAANLKPYLVKGKLIAVDGYLKQDHWEKDGQKFSKVSIVANNVQLLDRGNGSGNTGYGNGVGGQTSGGAPTFQATNNQPQGNFYNNYPQNSFGDMQNDFQEDIPF